MLIYLGDGLYNRILAVAAFIVGSLLILMYLFELISAKKTKITLTQSKIIFRKETESVSQYWKSINAVRVSGQGESRQIILVGTEGNLAIPCRFFSETSVLSTLQEYLPSEVFDETSYRKTQQSQELQGNLRQRLGSVDRTLKVSLGKIERGVAVTGIIGGLVEAGRYFYNKEIIEGWIGVAFFLGSGMIGAFLSRGWIEATNEIIIIRTTFRRHEFLWGTMQEVFTSSKTGMIALVGYNNRVVLPGPATWSGEDKELLSELIQSKITASKIQPVENPKIFFWRSKTF